MEKELKPLVVCTIMILGPTLFNCLNTNFPTQGIQTEIVIEASESETDDKK
jgi:hypothetical protein